MGPLNCLINYKPHSQEQIASGLDHLINPLHLKGHVIKEAAGKDFKTMFEFKWQVQYQTCSYDLSQSFPQKGKPRDGPQVIRNLVDFIQVQLELCRVKFLPRYHPWPLNQLYWQVNRKIPVKFVEHA